MTYQYVVSYIGVAGDVRTSFWLFAENAFGLVRDVGATRFTIARLSDGVILAQSK